MVEVSPFQAWRYDLSQVGELANVIAPPYDVIGPEFQNDLYKKHPCNVIRLDLNRAEPGDQSADDRYSRAANFLKHWKLDGVLRQDREESFYVYHQVFDWEGRKFTRKGFLARLKLEEFGKGKVFPHEQTLSGPKLDRLMLTRATQTNLSPIFGLYPDEPGDVQRLLDDACTTLTATETHDHLGVLHRVWVVSDRTVIENAKRMLREKPVFIADGHHRYETGLNYRRELQAAGVVTNETHPANFVLCTFVGMQDSGLVIFPTHRLVSGLPKVTCADVKAALEPYCEVEVIGRGAEAAQQTWGLIDADGGQNVLGFGTVADDTWLFVRITDPAPMKELAASQSDAWRGLGVSLLHRMALEHLIFQKLAATSPQFKYVHLLEEVTAATAEKSCQLACLVPPAQIEHVREIAASGETMPPKSTYFYPKLLTGLVFNPLS